MNKIYIKKNYMSKQIQTYVNESVTLTLTEIIQGNQVWNFRLGKSPLEIISNNYRCLCVYGYTPLFEQIETIPVISSAHITSLPSKLQNSISGMEQTLCRRRGEVTWIRSGRKLGLTDYPRSIVYCKTLSCG